MPRTGLWAGVAALCWLAGPVAAQAQAEQPLLDFAAQVEATLAQGDGSFMDGSFDLNAFLDVVTAGVDAPAGFNDGFRKGVFQSNNLLGKQLSEAMKSGQGSYTFLRLLPGQPRRALFRLITDAGLNYHELYLNRDANGRVTYTDVYLHISGERMSATMRRVYLAGVAQANRGVLDKLLGREVEYVKHLEEIKRLGLLVRQGQHAQAMAIYERLPVGVQLQSEVLLLRIQAAAGVSEAAYAEAMNAYAAACPDSPALDLLGIDRHLLRKEYALTRAAVDKIDARVGGDPYLELMRANLHSLTGEHAKARASCEAAAKREPGLSYLAQCSLLDVVLAQKDWKATAEVLTRLEREFGMQWKDLTTVEAFAGFVRSPEYKAWLERDRQGEQGD